MNVALAIVFSVAMILLPVSILIGGLNHAAAKGAVPVEATVVRLEERVDSDGDLLYYPIFEFEVEGQVKDFESNVGSTPPAHKIGDKKSLAYNVTKDKAIGSSFVEVYGIPIGLALLAMGAVTWLGCVVVGQKYFHVIYPNLG